MNHTEMEHLKSMIVVADSYYRAATLLRAQDHATLATYRNPETYSDNFHSGRNRPNDDPQLACLALAGELYLKAMMKLEGKYPMTTHDWSELYNALPSTIRSEMEMQIRIALKSSMSLQEFEDMINGLGTATFEWTLIVKALDTFETGHLATHFDPDFARALVEVLRLHVHPRIEELSRSFTVH